MGSQVLLNEYLKYIQGNNTFIWKLDELSLHSKEVEYNHHSTRSPQVLQPSVRLPEPGGGVGGMRVGGTESHCRQPQDPHRRRLVYHRWGL